MFQNVGDIETFTHEPGCTLDTDMCPICGSTLLNNPYALENNEYWYGCGARIKLVYLLDRPTKEVKIGYETSVQLLRLCQYNLDCGDMTWKTT